MIKIAITILLLILSCFTIGQIKSYNTKIELSKIQAKCDEVITKPGDLGEEYSVVKKDGNLAIYSYKLDSLVETKIDSFKATGCFNNLLVFKGDSICMTDVENNWVSHYLPEISKIEEEECEMTQTQILTKSGKKYELWIHSATLIPLSDDNNQKKCLKLVENIKDQRDELEYVRNVFHGYYSICDCNQNEKELLVKKIEAMELYPRFYKFDFVKMLFVMKAGQLMPKHIRLAEGAEKEKCGKLADKLSEGKEKNERVPLKTLLELEKAGCIVLEYP